MIGQPARQDLVGRIKGASYELGRTPDTPGTSETHSKIGPSPNEEIILGRETEEVQLKQNCKEPTFLQQTTLELELNLILL